MSAARAKFTILMADDDADDRMLTGRILKAEHLADDFHTVENGEELLDYLHRRGRYSDPGSSPTPSVVLLDLNMPKMSGREALAEIKADEGLRALPILVFSTSKADEDVVRCYKLGANSYINKPDSYEGLVTILRTVRKYWKEIVEVPE